MAKSETITTRAPGSGKKTPVKKAPHSAKPKSKGTARKATSSKAGAARKATKSKKGSSKTKPRGKTEAEEPYPTWAAPTPAAAVEAVARLAAVHGLPSPPERKSILDSLVRTILSQNTTDKTSAVAFARLKEGLPTWSQVLDAPEGVAEDLVRCGGLAEVKMERVRAILRDDRVRTDGEPSLEWLHAKPDAEVKAVLNSFKGVGPKTVRPRRPAFTPSTRDRVLHTGRMCHDVHDGPRGVPRRHSCPPHREEAKLAPGRRVARAGLRAPEPARAK